MDSNEPHSRRDPLFVLILLGVGVVSVWLLLMPFSPAIARATMKRFHLSTDSFAWWAVQAPVPAMYNFGNRYEIRDLPEGLITPVIDASRPRYINHFPTRVLTFANGRYSLLHPGQDRWVTLWSSYRGQTLITKIHAKPIGEGRFKWIRESSTFSSPEEMP
ncbi:hypothetical protein Mal15_06880 [Stieleria maiorica]|uniref:Uncharacterized protein n=1 Tax=Stieleria maiorica TaxID=2795974 RepID=A0A5B9M9E6_9BACT|nr:hypothetical protein [Stieleria maiorica]QEF96660.1 hypothetical protein Mal15_06880 [Stieleria maiorica]